MFSGVFHALSRIWVSAGYATRTTRMENLLLDASCHDHLQLKLFRGICRSGVGVRRCKIPLPAIYATIWRRVRSRYFVVGWCRSVWLSLTRFWYWNFQRKRFPWWCWRPKNSPFSLRDLHSWKTRGELSAAVFFFRFSVVDQTRTYTCTRLEIWFLRCSLIQWVFQLSTRLSPQQTLKSKADVSFIAGDFLLARQ